MGYENRDDKRKMITDKDGKMTANVSERKRSETDVVYSLPCDVVRDLLPSYAEKLTSEMTTSSVKYHLKNCTACSEALNAMQSDDQDMADIIAGGSDINVQTSLKNDSNTSNDLKEIDYLKKVRRRFLAGMGICAIVSLLLLCCFWFIQLKLYGYDMSPDYLNYSVSVENNVVEFGGAVKEEKMAVADIRFIYNDGAVKISGKMEPKVPWNRRDFRERFTADKRVDQVWVGEDLVWENGKTVPEDVGRLYSVKAPYIGDISACGKVVTALGVATEFGSFSNELQTMTEPYGWGIKFHDPIDAGGKDIDKQLDLLRRDSYMMIALIDNLGYMKWEYRTMESDEIQTLTVTQKEATQALGSDIKKCTENTETLRAAMERFNLY